MPQEKTSVQKIQSEIKRRKTHGILITNPTNIFYLAGFKGISPEEREASLLIKTDSAQLFLPAMYKEEGKNLDLVKKKILTLIVSKERDNLLTSWIKYVNEKQTILFEGDNLTVNELKKIKDLTNTKLIDQSGLIERLRTIKSKDEIRKIKRAVQITDKVFLKTIQFLNSKNYETLTEQDIAEFIKKTGTNLGGEGLMFDSIVASGKGSAAPHHITSSKKLKKGDLLLLDFGIKYAGYGGDLTRCISLGKASDEIKKIYKLVLESNEKSIAACKPGVLASDIYHIGNNVFKSHNFEKYFFHRLGHAIGLDVHENPSLWHADQTPLKEGMTITIEPGLYFEKKFGIRIEDYVLITKTGHEVLSKSPKSIIEI